MILGDIFERFAQQSPVTVMTQALLENALPPATVDRLFEDVAERQYTRELLFSDVVNLMGASSARSAPRSAPPRSTRTSWGSLARRSTRRSTAWNWASAPPWSATPPTPWSRSSPP